MARGTWNEVDVEEFYFQILAGQVDEDEVEDEVAEVRTFADVGMMTRNRGLVVTMKDGTEFQLTIVQSR